jgi:hypothetical protein
VGRGWAGEIFGGELWVVCMKRRRMKFGGGVVLALATRARRACPLALAPADNRQGLTRTNGADRRSDHSSRFFPHLILIFIIELSYAAAPLAHTISDPLIRCAVWSFECAWYWYVWVFFFLILF